MAGGSIPYIWLGIGPGVVSFLILIAPKSLLVLLSFTSAFYWLLVLLITSAIFRGFLPVEQSQSSYTGLLVGSVAIQELARYGLWKLHAKAIPALERIASARGDRFDLLDRLYLALGWGYGHGAAHVVFFFLSFVPLLEQDGTWYYEQCPSMSMFLGGALYSLAFGMLLPSLMVIAWEGYHEGNRLHVAYAPVMHMGAALITLANFKRDGCMWTMPVLIVLGFINMVYAGRICYAKVSSPSATLRPLLTDSTAPAAPALAGGDAEASRASHSSDQPEEERRLTDAVGSTSSSHLSAGSGDGGAARRRGSRAASVTTPRA